MARTFIRDSYSDTRGGQSIWINLFCASCGEWLAQYQKDYGAPEHSGPLYRGYLDRFARPKGLVATFRQIHAVTELQPLCCEGCGATVAIPLLYTKESRLALEFQRAAVIKRTLDGELYEPTDIHEE
ncbi:MAG: hypothetical protein CO132_02705 [Candidatus Kerfeldbacteria bacterium CG_4_9_14_3_um_filter_45_8]|nr:MAG: hypothetical protein CO132_02705 [Candidatus Kerfeldbacteria bacterium CG_4_9_14_3_um_filter_45_8]